jgi:hypothetical protein
MSAKATGLSWDLACPAVVNGIPFRSNHKYILIAYADHADHNGRNIFPAISTVSKKTGLDDRTVQRMTRDLEEMGYLVEDGQGPRGTNRWKLPYNDRGDSLTPVRLSGVAESAIPSGDSPSGDIPSGDSLTPELNKPLTPLNNIDDIKILFLNGADLVFPEVKDLSSLRTVKAELETASIIIDNGTYIVSGLPCDRAEYYESRYRKSFERAFVGLIGEEVSIKFMSSGDVSPI